MMFKSIGISRHRIGRDGVGVTTLVGGYGCPLDCKYCLNPQCKSGKPLMQFTAKELYERVAIDSLYFAASGGGIVFGGGEPLLQAEFIREFILYTRDMGENWRFTLETCLAVDLSKLVLLDGLIDEYIVDIKDMSDSIYEAYTEKNATYMKAALNYLSPRAEQVLVRVPQIPQYNTDIDTENSVDKLCKLGYTRFDRFTYVVGAGSKKM